jgi:AcrR family transcriptional regulator
LQDKIIASVAKQINLYGVKRFTIDDIVRDLGISKKTVYKYFKSKDELVSEFLSSSIEGNIKRTLDAVEAEENLVDKIGAALISYHKFQIPIELLDDIQKYYPDDWKKIEEQRSFKLQLVKDLIREGIRTDKIRSNINIEILSMILDKTTRAIFEYSFLRDNNLSINSAVKEIENILLYGVLPK